MRCISALCRACQVSRRQVRTAVALSHKELQVHNYGAAGWLVHRLTRHCVGCACACLGRVASASCVQEPHIHTRPGLGGIGGLAEDKDPGTGN